MSANEFNNILNEASRRGETARGRFLRRADLLGARSFVDPVEGDVFARVLEVGRASTNVLPRMWSG